MKAELLKKFSVIILLIIIIFQSIPASAYTPSYDEKFYYAGYGYGTGIHLRSPIRDGEEDDYPTITSKYNNPRPLGSSPHGGVDFNVGIETEVYPLANCRVIAYNDTVIDPNFGYYLIVQFDMDGDGNFDNVYARYAHLTEICVKDKTIEDTIATDTVIALSGQTATEGAPHLHVDLRDNNTSNTGVYHSLPWQQYYSNRLDWNYGKDLDWLCVDSKNNRTFSIYCYGKNCGVDIIPESVKLYIRVRDSGSAWSEYTMNHEGSYKYSCTVLPEDFPDGTQIEYFFCGKRGNMGSQYNPYGLYPAKFKAPEIPPVSTINFARYYSVISSECSHVWGSWQTVIEATCISTGLERRTCSICGATEERTTPIDSDNHDWQWVFHHNYKNEYTCPYRIFVDDQKCTRCGIWRGLYFEYEVYEGHDWEWVTYTSYKNSSTCPYRVYKEDERCTTCYRWHGVDREYEVYEGHDWEWVTYTSYKNSSTCPYRVYKEDEKCTTCYVWHGVDREYEVYEGHDWGSWRLYYAYYDELTGEFVECYYRECSTCGEYDYKEERF
jgi:murein DD-endopeptidase MepM/ murein hydrolase activator NlpD